MSLLKRLIGFAIGLYAAYLGLCYGPAIFPYRVATLAAFRDTPVVLDILVGIGAILSVVDAILALYGFIKNAHHFRVDSVNLVVSLVLLVYDATLIGMLLAPDMTAPWAWLLSTSIVVKVVVGIAALPVALELVVLFASIPIAYDHYMKGEDVGKEIEEEIEDTLEPKIDAILAALGISRKNGMWVNPSVSVNQKLVKLLEALGYDSTDSKWDAPITSVGQDIETILYALGWKLDEKSRKWLPPEQGTEPGEDFARVHNRLSGLFSRVDDISSQLKELAPPATTAESAAEQPAQPRLVASGGA